MIKNERGNITVFLALFLPFFFLLLGALVDIVSMKYTTNILKETLYGSCDSLLSQYNKGLRDQYNLFAIGDTVEYYEDQETLLLDNLYGKAIILENQSIEVLSPLKGDVLKNQILEEMKIDGFIEIGKILIDKLDFIQEAFNLEKLPSFLGDSSGNMETVIKENVASNMANIKDLEERKRNGEEGLDDLIENLYKENKELLILAEDIKDGGLEELNKDGEKIRTVGLII